SGRTIADLTARRAAAQADRERLLEDIRTLRESETVEHPEVAPGFAGTLAGIARAIGDTAADGWVPDRVGGESPLSAPELAELLRLSELDAPPRRDQRLLDGPP